MHVKVSFRVAQKWAKVRRAVRRWQWVHDHASWDGSDFEWEFAHWEAVQEARASVR